MNYKTNTLEKLILGLLLMLVSCTAKVDVEGTHNNNTAEENEDPEKDGANDEGADDKSSDKETNSSGTSSTDADDNANTSTTTTNTTSPPADPPPIDPALTIDPAQSLITGTTTLRANGVAASDITVTF